MSLERHSLEACRFAVATWLSECAGQAALVALELEQMSLGISLLDSIDVGDMLRGPLGEGLRPGAMPPGLDPMLYFFPHYLEPWIVEVRQNLIIGLTTDLPRAADDRPLWLTSVRPKRAACLLGLLLLELSDCFVDVQ